jgi:hypothetical protein
MIESPVIGNGATNCRLRRHIIPSAADPQVGPRLIKAFPRRKIRKTKSQAALQKSRPPVTVPAGRPDRRELSISPDIAPPH